jgi:3-hydroxyisobutyrate dehydrogenase-like beta-hydroxyacid dehydrogenase
MKVGFIGLGNMGLAMAMNLLKAGYELTVYNRTAQKARPLLEQGARVAANPAETSSADVVFTMLADDPALESVTFGESGILANLRPGSIHISSSTISVALSQKLTAAHEKHNQSFISAPVFGRPEAAEAGKLFVVIAGPNDGVERCAPLFDAIGQRTFRFGEQPWVANLIKLSGNFLIASVLESLSEAMALVTKAGIDQHDYLDFLASTLFTAPVYKTYGGLIADKKFQPAGFAAPLGLKDVRLTLAAGEQFRVPLPLASLIRDRFLALLARGGDSLDWSAISQIAVEDSGQSGTTAERRNATQPKEKSFGQP